MGSNAENFHESGNGDFLSTNTASLLKHQKDHVLRLWVERVRAAVPAARGMGYGDILDSLPAFLKTIARFLEGAPNEKELLDVAHVHGLTRAKQVKFNVEDVQAEYILLWEVLCEELVPGGNISAQDLKLIGRLINIASHEAVRTLSNNSIADYKGNESRFEQMVRVVTDFGIFMLDPQGMISTWNAGAERIKQYKAEEAIGQHFSLLYRDEDRKLARADHNLRKAIEQGRYEEEWWRQKKDGSLFWAKITITPLYSETGEVRGFLKVVSDFTDRKKYQDELEQINHDLERFASTAAHDLREPLRTVTTFLRIVDQKLQGVESKDIAEYRTYITSAADRMKELIETLLNYARVGGKRLNIEHVSVSDCVAAAKLRLGTSINDAKAQILEEEFPVVSGDKMLLTQLFQNLLSNAIKFGQKDKVPEVRVEARRQGKEWVFAVRDNGIGMAPEDVERVFGTFQRVHTKGDYPGTGLGLSICRRIVDAHGGRIWAESKVCEGTTFFFTLPMNELKAAA